MAKYSLNSKTKAIETVDGQTLAISKGSTIEYDVSWGIDNLPDIKYIPSFYSHIDTYINNGWYAYDNNNGNNALWDCEIVTEPLIICKIKNEPIETYFGVCPIFNHNVDKNYANMKYLYFGTFIKSSEHITETNSDGWWFQSPSALTGTFINNTQLNSESTIDYWKQDAFIDASTPYRDEFPIAFVYNYFVTNNIEQLEIRWLMGIKSNNYGLIKVWIDNIEKSSFYNSFKKSNKWIAFPFDIGDAIYTDNKLYYLENNTNKKLLIDDITIYKFNDYSSNQGGLDSNPYTYDNTSDEIDFGVLPSVSAITSNFVTLYCPTQAQLSGFAEYLWSDDFNSQVQQNWINPMDMIISSHIIPLNLVTSEPKTIYIGGISTGLTASTIDQYIQFDCGTINIEEYFGSFLDYTQTKIEIKLPFLESINLSIDEVMGSEINVKYNIDLMTGDFVCMIRIKKKNVLNGILYHFFGNCATMIPLTSVNFTSQYAQKYNEIKSTIQGIQGITNSALSGNPIATANGIVNGVMNITDANVSSTLSQKAKISHSSSGKSNAHYLDILYPYLIITRPIQSIPKDLNKFIGYPCNITAKLSDLQGFTAISDIALDNMALSTSEREELMQLLSNGIYI